MMEVSVSSCEGTPLLRLTGRLDALGAAGFERAGAGIDPGAHRWLVDLAGVTYLSSAGVAALVAAEKRLRLGGGGLVLFAAPPAVTSLLEMTGLLGELALVADLDAARRVLTAAAPAQVKVGSLTLEVGALDPAASWLDVWGDGGEPAPATLAELQVALGRGALGGDRSEAREATGDLLVAGGLAGVRLPGAAPADFLVTDRPADAVLLVDRAVALSGPPRARVTARARGAATLGELVAGLRRVMEASGPLGFVALAEGAEPGATDALLVVGLSNPEPLPDWAAGLPAGLLARAVELHGGAAAAGGLAETLAAVVRRGLPQGIRELAASAPVGTATVWVWLPGGQRTSRERRVAITIPGGAEVPDAWDLLARRIYADAGQVTLEPLHGGFSATTFRVTSYAPDGTRLLPTVLKIGPARMIRQEEEACRTWVQRYILNNGTVVLGSATLGEWGGLAYNFVGIAGPSSRLTWLRAHVLERPVGEVTALFDRIFTDVLKPWYGQPKWGPVALWADHDPSGQLFSGLVGRAEEALGLSAGDPTIDCPPLGRRLPNPYWVLAHVYPERRERTTLYYTTVCHGDLNLQNILLDERENVYIIDFSETRPRNAVSDFARLEPILFIELAPIADEEELGRRVRYAEALAAAPSLEHPPAAPPGDDPALARAHAAITRLRRYADVVTLFERTMVPYWLAVLEWTLPIACYGSASPLQKRLALYSAGLLCEQVLRAEPS